MFKNQSLSALIGTADELTVMLRGLMQAVEDHGGNAHHMGYLLDDIKGKGDLVKSLAKLVVGPIWKLVESPPLS